MKIELEIDDFKFKKGDFISYLIGPNQDTPVVFWIQNTEIEGSFWIHGDGYKEIVVEGAAYLLSCQEFIENWLTLGTVLVCKKDEVEKRGQLVKWNKPPIPCKK